MIRWRRSHCRLSARDTPRLTGAGPPSRKSARTDRPPAPSSSDGTRTASPGDARWLVPRSFHPPRRRPGDAARAFEHGLRRHRYGTDWLPPECLRAASVKSFHAPGAKRSPPSSSTASRISPSPSAQAHGDPLRVAVAAGIVDRLLRDAVKFVCGRHILDRDRSRALRNGSESDKCALWFPRASRAHAPSRSLRRRPGSSCAPPFASAQWRGRSPSRSPGLSR